MADKREKAKAGEFFPSSNNWFDYVIRTLYNVAYRGHLAFNFLRRPETQGAYVAVWHADQVLLIRNSYKPGFTLPCGGIELDESPKNAARRELQEEVGLDLPLSAFCFVYKTLSHSEFKKDHISFFETHQESLVRIIPDGQEVIWAGFKKWEDALSLPLFPPVREYLLRHGPKDVNG